MKSHDTNGGSGLASSSQRIGEPDPTAPCREDDAPAVLNAVAPSRLLFDHAPDAILVADVHGHYVDANLSALALLGYSRKELLQLSVGDVVANGPLWAAEEYARFVREAQWQGEVTLRAKDGRLVPAEAHAVVIPWIEGDAYVSFLRDLTERHRHHAVQARLAALVTSTGDAVMSETVDGIITDWNPAAESLFGYTASEVLGHPVAILAPPRSCAGDRRPSGSGARRRHGARARDSASNEGWTATRCLGDALAGARRGRTYYRRLSHHP